MEIKIINYKENNMNIPSNILKKRARILFNRELLVLFFIASAFVGNGQNLNSPNKRGPLGTQVNMLSGNLFIPRTDIYIPARGFNLDISFSYNSFLFSEDYGYGKGWTFKYNLRYSHDTVPGARIILWGDGREDKYDSLPGGEFQSPKGFFSKLKQFQPGQYVLTQLDSVKYFFNNPLHKRITRIEDPNGNFINFSYTDTLLTAMTNGTGQSITFTYNAEGRLATVTDAVAAPSRIFSYIYDSGGNLKEVKDPLNGKYQYTYLVNGPMKSLADKNNNKVDIIYFPDLTMRELVGCNKRLSFSYDTSNKINIATDHLSSGNQVTKYTYQNVGNLSWVSSISGNCCGFNISYEYDIDGNKTKVKDANGQIYTYSYDGKGNVLSATDPIGNISTYTYTNDYNKISSYKDANGSVYTLSYDTKGNLIQIITPGNNIYTATYNGHGDIISGTDPKGNTYTYNYDSYGNPATVTGPAGYLAALSFDGRGNLLSFTDARGSNSLAEYDILNRLKKITDPINNSVQFSYDAQGNLVSVKNKNNETSTYNYDASNRVVKTTGPTGNTSEFNYDGMNNLLSVKNALGHETKYSYDNRNRLKSVKDPENNNIIYSYDGNGNIIAASFPNGRNINYTYDAINRLTSLHDETGMLATYTYDKNSNITSYTNGTGAKSVLTYDSLNRVKQVTGPLGNSTIYAYDKNNNIISVTDREGHTRFYSYDSLNRVKTYTDNNGSLIQLGYDAESNITSITDQNNNITNFSYDSLNRRKRMSYPGGSYNEMSYDSKGNLITFRLTDASVITYQYDTLNRVKSRTLPGGEIISFTYDKLNRVLSATNNNGTVTFTYDALNRVTSESFDNRTVRYNYSISGRTQTIIYPDSTIVIKEFDARNRLVNISKDNVKQVEYAYNNTNQLTQKNLANGVKSIMEYDFANRLISINTGDLQQTLFTYDKEFNKTAINRFNNSSLSEQFSYDNSYRLTNFKKGPAGNPVVQNTYTYDAAGNRISANLNTIATTYTVNNLNQLIGVNGLSFTYDGRGNLTFDGTFYKTYDAENRLIRDSSAPSNIIRYGYDALGRRVTKTINGNQLKYSYSGASQIEERNNNNNLLTRTVYSGFLSPVLNEKNGNSFYYHTNELGSVEAISNSNGRLIESYQYDAFGKPYRYDSTNNPLTTSIAGNRFGFTGQEYDSATSSYRFYFRNYSPEIGVFNQRDLIEYEDGMGMYQYVGNNPANGVDVLGLKKLEKDPCYHDPNKRKYVTEWEAQRVIETMKYKQETYFPDDDFISVWNGLAIADSRFYNDVKFEKQFGARDLYFRGEALYNYEVNYYFTGYASGYRGIDPISTNVGTRVYLGLKGSAGPLFGKSFDLPAVTEAIPIPFIGNNNRTSNITIGSYDGLLDRYGFPEEYTENTVGKNFDNKVTEFGEWWPVIDPKTKEIGYEFFPNINIPDEKYDEFLEFVKINCSEGGSNREGKWVYDEKSKTWHYQPFDPNLITGPQGKPDKAWVSVKDRLPYTIQFENDSNATARARYVKITSPIEPKQDPATLELGSVGFNNQVFDIPAGTASYYQRLDARDSAGVYVDLTAGYDFFNNQLFWEFQAIDPVTLLPPEDPMAGFLFLKDSIQSEYGKGFVNFSIKPRADAQTLDTIGARAFIVFDENDVIPTNIHTNTIDAVAPTSQVTQLSSNSNNPIHLSWTGNDDPNGSGIDYYTVYISTDLVNYSILFHRVYGNDTTFTLPPDANYCFFVLATDITGNAETLRTGATTCTSIGNPVPVSWLYFNGTNREKNNLLKWATANEQNSKEFRLERSLNGTSFTQIASIPAAGNSSSARHYQYTDMNIHLLNSPIMFYRLKQVDNDANFNYSAIVRLTYLDNSIIPSIVYPNPTNGQINILIGDLKQLGTEATITDINGRILKKFTITSANQAIDLSNFVNGLYFVRLKNKEVLKIIKQ